MSDHHLCNLCSASYLERFMMYGCQPSEHNASSTHMSTSSIPLVANDIVTLITANSVGLNGFSHIANDMPLVSVTMFPQCNSVGNGNLHK